MKRVNRLVFLLFSICFFIYAASPLSAVYHQDQTRQAASTNNGIRLLIVELLLSPLTQHDKGNETSSRCLLRKKRATLSPDKLKIIKKQLKNDVVASRSIISSGAVCLWILTKDREPLQTVFHLPHSGLSPPSA